LPPPRADLEAECLASAGKWKTIRIEYDVEGASPARVTFAMERGGRVLLRAEPGPTIVLDGGWNSFRTLDESGKVVLARVPVGSLLASATAVLEGKPIPPRGEPPPVPPDRAIADIALSLSPKGQAERHLTIAFSLSDRPAFGWLDRLRPSEGVTIRAVDRSAVASGPAGRVVIDRDTGALLDWTLEPPAGRPSRIRATSLEVDKPLDPEIFVLAGSPAPPVMCRQILLTHTINFCLQLASGGSDRTPRVLAMARAYYRHGWTAAEIDRLAGLGAARRNEVARRLKEANPDIAQSEIDAAASQAAVTPIADALEAEVRDEVQLFARLARPKDPGGFQEAFFRILDEEITRPAFEAARNK